LASHPILHRERRLSRRSPLAKADIKSNQSGVLAL
jgi:hypothetical protein